MALIKDEILELVEIPEKIELNEKNQIQVVCEETGEPHTDT
ncbi:MAG: hypothetical protein AB2L12_01370 [Smithellaceae bacterium]